MRTEQPEGFTDEPRDVLELIARLLVGTAYRMPVEGVGSAQGLQAYEVAGALGYMQDNVAAETALCVATGAKDPAIARLAWKVYREVARLVRETQPAPLDLRKPADRMRLRIVVFDAAHELVWPARREPYSVLAAQAKMRKETYLAAFRLASSVLAGALADGRREFGYRLFG